MHLVSLAGIITTQAYSQELDSFDEDTPYGQKEMIEVIERLKNKKKFLFD